MTSQLALDELPSEWEFETSIVQTRGGSTVHTVSFDGWTQKRMSNSHRYTHAVILFTGWQSDRPATICVLSWHTNRASAEKVMRRLKHMPGWKMMIVGIR